MIEQIKKLAVNHSIREICEKTGLSYTPVRYWLKKLGIKTNPSPNRQKIPNENRYNKVTSWDWLKIQESYDNGKSWREIIKEFKISSSTLNKAVDNGVFKTRNHLDGLKLAGKNGKLTRHYDQAQRDEISKKVIELFKRRPELHPNRKVANNRKVMSYPEKLVFDLLTSLNIKFEHNKKALKYFIDFYLTDYNIGIEVDGERWHNAEYDEKRDAEISTIGIKILRFKAKEVNKNSSVVLSAIQ